MMICFLGYKNYSRETGQMYPLDQQIIRNLIDGKEQLVNMVSQFVTSVIL